MKISIIYFRNNVANMQDNIKQRLKEAMKARNVSTPKLAVILGIPQDRIYAWFRDNSNPKIEDRLKLEKWLSDPKSIGENSNSELQEDLPPPYSSKSLPTADSEIIKALIKRLDSDIEIFRANHETLDSHFKWLQKIYEASIQKIETNLDDSSSNQTVMMRQGDVLMEYIVYHQNNQDEEKTRKEMNRLRAMIASVVKKEV